MKVREPPKDWCPRCQWHMKGTGRPKRCEICRAVLIGYGPARNAEMKASRRRRLEERRNGDDEGNTLSWC